MNDILNWRLTATSAKVGIRDSTGNCIYCFLVGGEWPMLPAEAQQPDRVVGRVSSHCRHGFRAWIEFGTYMS